jgi:hypothetical protein
VVTGKVENVVDITPRTVSLKGAPGELLEAMVTISPREKYKFSILGLEQKFNNQIKAELVKPDNETLPWLVKIKASSKKADDFYDIITLKTDSEYKPTLKIRVYAIFVKDETTK